MSKSFSTVRERVIFAVLGVLIAGSIAGAVARWYAPEGPLIAEESPHSLPSGTSPLGSDGPADPAP